MTKRISQVAGNKEITHFPPVNKKKLFIEKARHIRSNAVLRCKNYIFKQRLANNDDRLFCTNISTFKLKDKDNQKPIFYNFATGYFSIGKYDLYKFDINTVQSIFVDRVRDDVYGNYIKELSEEEKEKYVRIHWITMHDEKGKKIYRMDDTYDYEKIERYENRTFHEEYSRRIEEELKVSTNYVENKLHIDYTRPGYIGIHMIVPEPYLNIDIINKYITYFKNEDSSWVTQQYDPDKLIRSEDYRKINNTTLGVPWNEKELRFCL